MVFLVFSSAFFCRVFFGNGVLFAAMLGCSARKGLALRAFLGISFTALFFSIVQFFVPLSAFTLVFPTVAGMGGIFQFVRSKQHKEYALSRAELLCAALLFLLPAVFYSSWGYVLSSDTPLRHAPIVSWLNYSRIVPGIANLHFT